MPVKRTMEQRTTDLCVGKVHRVGLSTSGLGPKWDDFIAHAYGSDKTTQIAYGKGKSFDEALTDLEAKLRAKG